MKAKQPVKKVLIVDDEEPIRIFIKHNLSKINIQVIEAADGELGLSLALSEKPQLILLDVIMPKMHGIDMLRRLREDEWGQGVPVVLLTNYAEDPRVVEAVNGKLCELLEKGRISIDDVVNKIKEKVKIA